VWASGCRSSYACSLSVSFDLTFALERSIFHACSRVLVLSATHTLIPQQVTSSHVYAFGCNGTDASGPGWVVQGGVPSNVSVVLDVELLRFGEENVLKDSFGDVYCARSFFDQRQCIRVHIYANKFVHICMYLCTQGCIRKTLDMNYYVHVCIDLMIDYNLRMCVYLLYIHISTCIHTSTHTHAPYHAHAHAHMHTHTHKNTNTHTHAHTHTHTHMRTQVPYLSHTCANGQPSPPSTTPPPSPLPPAPPPPPPLLLLHRYPRFM